MRRRPNKDSVHGHPGHGNRGQRHGSQGHSGHGYGGQEHGSHGHEGHGLGGQGHSRHGHDDHGHVGHGHYGKKTQHGNEAPEGLAEEAKSQRTPEELARRTIVKKVMDKCTQWWERAVEMLPER
ncbi:Hypothetical protein CINCED_3A002825 [Cinara cedri]|uniref:Uncharacterized protein n=1 Tax=Cinara cedri TaxID=506608 RepID=A0A5E4M757_9HEMI|nr:Hypothetical protein CINCED_3A002825 [Cinara cedri]